MKDLRASSLGKAEHVDGAVDIDLSCLNRVALIVNWRGGARKIIYFVDLYEGRKSDIVTESAQNLGLSNKWLTLRRVPV